LFPEDFQTAPIARLLPGPQAGRLFFGDFGMLIKSAILTQGSGSVGGMTLSHNSGGLYLRARTIPTDPGSVFQTVVRNAMSLLSTRWSNGLTPAQRDAWGVYGSNVPMTNPLGDPINLSGISHYVRSNVPRIQAGMAIVDDGPVIYTLAPQEATLYSASEATQLISVQYLDGRDWASETGSALLIFASRPQQPSINFFKGPYRLAGTIDGVTGTPPLTPQDVSAPFPFVDGHRIYMNARVTRADGRLSSPFPGWTGASA
jgi:hypothetical protein